MSDPPDTIDRSKDWSYIPRALSVHGAIDEDLLKRVAKRDSRTLPRRPQRS